MRFQVHCVPSSVIKEISTCCSDEVTGISPKQSIVHLKHRDLEYDFLILATGIRYSYFGHDEWRQFAPGLESLDDADVIRSKILLAFERAEAIASTPQA